MLKVYTYEQHEQWDSIVRSFVDYDVYWLSGYVNAFRIHGDGEPLLISYDDGSTRGINVAMKRDIAKDRHFKGILEEGVYYDLSSPYGYGGWIIEGEDKANLFKAYADWISRNKIVSEFVRFHPMIKNQVSCYAFYDVIQLGEVVHMDLSSPEAIWSNITSKNRNMIRKAVKNGVKIYNGRFPEIYERFRNIYNGTMKKDEADSYYFFGKEFYKSILEDLSGNAQVFWAEKDGQTISSAIMLAANGKMSYHLSGSLREFNSFAPTNLLLYKAALWGCMNGCSFFYLGGGVGSEEDSLFKFKRSFYKGDLNHFFIGKKIYDHAKYDMLIGMREDINNHGFFPVYRG